MRAGRIVAQGTLDELRGPGTAMVRITTPDPGAAARVLADRGMAPALPDGPAGDVRGVLPDGLAPDALVAALVAAGVRVRGFAVDEPSLEDRFVALTGEGFDVEG